MTKAFPDRLQRANQMASPRGSMSSSWIGVISHSSIEDRGLLILMRQSTEIEVTSRASRTQGYITHSANLQIKTEKKKKVIYKYKPENTLFPEDPVPPSPIGMAIRGTHRTK